MKAQARTLQLRRRRDGSVTITGDLPEVHDFSARWIDRYLGDLVRVTVTVLTRDADGNTTEIPYDLVGFQPVAGPDGQPVLEDAEGEPTIKKNWTGWQARRIGE